MLSGYSLMWCLNPKKKNFGDPRNLLGKKLQEIVTAGLMDSLLWYYWDNENEVIDNWQVPKKIIKTVKSIDPEHPIYALQGQHGIARKYNNQHGVLADITDTCVGGDPEGQGGGRQGALCHIVLSQADGQLSPVVVAQLNYGAGKEFRPRLYTAIARGAKGPGYLEDEKSNWPAMTGPVENELWWNGLPNIVHEISNLMPIFKQPYRSDWSVTTSNRKIKLGTRTYNGKGYIILANHGSESAEVQITLKGLN
jgi:hypothetical protein